MENLLLIFAGTVLVNNFVLAQFLGICPYLGVSRQVDTAFSMGMAVTFVMTMAAMVTFFIQNYLLIPLGLEYLQTVSFILVIASLVQLVEIFLRKVSPVLYRALGIFLPLITTNCAIMGLALLIPREGYNFIEAIVFALGAGVGFTLAIVLMAGLREQLEMSDMPQALRGGAITLIMAGLMAMAFMGFAGVIGT